MGGFVVHGGMCAVSARNESDLCGDTREEHQVGDIVRQRLGLHRNEPEVMWRITKITPVNVHFLGITRGRGSKNRSRVFKFTRSQAASMLTTVRKAQRAIAA